MAGEQVLFWRAITTTTGEGIRDANRGHHRLVGEILILRKSRRVTPLHRSRATGPVESLQMRKRGEVEWRGGSLRFALAVVLGQDKIGVGQRGRGRDGRRRVSTMVSVIV